MKPFPRNPRTISAAELTALEASMQEFGDLGGIVHSLETDEIIGGNQRISAMNAFGVSPTITQAFNPPTPQGTVALGYVEHPQTRERFSYRAVQWTPEQCKRANIIANAAGGHFAWGILSADFNADELAGMGLGTDALAAMQDGATELGRLMQTLDPPVVETADAGELELHLAPKRVNLGEIWQLGRHRIACIDSTDEKQVARLLDGAKPTFVWSDPPYGMDLDTDYSAMKGKLGIASGKKYNKVIGDKEEWDFRKADLFECDEQFWWGADWYRKTLPEGGSWLVWDKRRDQDQDNGFGSNFELCWSKARHKRWMIRIEWFGAFSGKESQQRVHPTQKPVALAVWCFERYGKANDIIFDGFLGSGISVLAAEQMNDGRTVYGADLAPEYCDWTIAKWEKSTGLVAERVI